MFWLKALNVSETLRIHNIFYNSALIITLCIVGYMTVVINVLLFCFELRAEDDQ